MKAKECGSRSRNLPQDADGSQRVEQPPKYSPQLPLPQFDSPASFFRITRVLLCIFVLTVNSESAAVAQANCALRFGNQANARSLASLWDDDRLYWVSQQALANSRYDVIVVGETLRLDAATFPMLARSDDRPISNWRKVTFDARKIIIAMPLVFTSTQVEFRAEEIIWEPEGRIALKQPPDSTGSDGVKFVADRIDFTKAAIVPLDFDSDNWGAYSSNDKDIPSNRRWTRSIILAAGSVSGTASSTDPWFWLRDLTRDKWDVLRGGTPATFSRRPYSISIGDRTATSKYLSVLKDEMLWPTAFASKLQRTFVQNPYDPNAQTFISQSLHMPLYRDLLSNMPRHQWAVSTLTNIADAVHRKVDLFGYPEEFIPRVKFEVLRAAFERQFAGTESLSLKIMERRLGDSASVASDADQQVERNNLDSRQAELGTSLQDLQNRGAQLTAGIEVLRQDFAAESANLDAFKKQVDNWAADKKKSMEERQKLSVGVDAIGLVGTAVISVYGTPAAGAAFAKGWGVVGGAVVGHQSGGTISNLHEAVSAVNDGVKQGEAWVQTSKEVTEKWQALKESGSHGKTVAQQVELSVSLIDVVDRQVAALAERARAAASTGSKFDMDPQWKSQADEFATKMNQLNQLIAQKQTEFKSVVDQIKASLDGLQSVAKLRVALNSQAPANDAERAELDTFYGGLSTNLMANLSASYSELVRAYLYSVRIPVQGFDLGPIRDGMVSLQNNQLQALASEGRSAPVATVAVSLYLQKIFDNYSQALLRMDGDVTASYGKVTAAAGFHEKWAYNISPGEDRQKRTVTRELNSAVANLFRQIRDGNGSVKEASTLVLLPIGLFLSPHPDTPELLKTLYADKIKATQIPRDARIELTVVHPGYGDIYHGLGCYFVDFSDRAARENTLKFPAVVSGSGDAVSAPSPDTVYALFPLRTNYALQIIVRRLRDDSNFDDWVSPSITELILDSNYVRY
ncbi:MAG TPA: hypothetical protein VNZ53_57275 [Steroidobacteraceae bacterium]|jgi:hypothetical protein|nr:hypothetical protein [Steroidobacteraceae bacterium]